MPDRALVRNAADPQQVKNATRLARQRSARFVNCLRESLQSPATRLVFAELLERAGLYVTSYDPSGSTMYFKEGRRNFGLELQAALLEADERAADLMEQERRARLHSDNRETDAVHTPAAGAETIPDGAEVRS